MEQDVSLSSQQVHSALIDTEQSTSTVAADEHFGDFIQYRQDKILRIGYVNINGIPECKKEAKMIFFDKQ